ncbi:MAG: hypothetical protein ACYDHH_02390 [Solirubrobacteraceae bacterium]
MRGLLLTVVSLVALAACGTTTTKTLTRVVSRPTTTKTVPPAPATGTNTVPPATATTTPPPPAAVGPVYFEGVVGNGDQRPSSLELTGDGTLIVSGVQWTSWGGPVATATGNAEYHGCTPNCAAAPVQTALVSIRLNTIRVCSGRQYYSGLTLTMSSGRLLEESYVQRSWSPC